MSHFTAKAVELQATDSAGPKAARGPLLQRSAGPSGANAAVPTLVQEVIHSQGQPLDAQTRAFMETRFEHDFSRVRVHADAPAARSARAVNALAWTVGEDMAFDDGSYQPASEAGRRLLAHELSHVVQQKNTRAGMQEASLEIGRIDDPAEREAEQTADAILLEGAGRPVSRLPRAQPGAAAMLRRQPKQDTYFTCPSGTTLIHTITTGSNYVSCLPLKNGAIVDTYDSVFRSQPTHINDEKEGDKEAKYTEIKSPLLIYPPRNLDADFFDVFVFFHGYRADITIDASASGHENVVLESHLQEAMAGTDRVGIAPQAHSTWTWSDYKKSWVQYWNWAEALSKVKGFDGLIKRALDVLQKTLSLDIPLEPRAIHVAGHSGGGVGIGQATDVQGGAKLFGDKVQDVTLQDAGYGGSHWEKTLDWFLHGSPGKTMRVLVSHSEGHTDKKPGDTRRVLTSVFNLKNINDYIAKKNESDTFAAEELTIDPKDNHSRSGGFELESGLVVKNKKTNELQGTLVVFFAPGGGHYETAYASMGAAAAAGPQTTTSFMDEAKKPGQYRVINRGGAKVFEDKDHKKEKGKALDLDTMVTVTEIKKGTYTFSFGSGKDKVTDTITADNALIKDDQGVELGWTPMANLAMPTAPLVQPKRSGASPEAGNERAEQMQASAAHGLLGPATRLPYLEQIQRAFGPRHDLSSVQAHLDEHSARAGRAMGAAAYTAGNQIAFNGWPDLQTAAHEAAHIVQQRRGVSLPEGVGRERDPYERHADAVAERVASGQSAAPILDGLSLHSGASGGGLQRRPLPRGAIPSSDLDPLDNRNENAFRARIYDAQQQWAIENRTFTAGIPDTELDDIEDGKKMLKTAVPDAKNLLAKARSDLADQQAANNAHAKKVRKIGIDNAYRGMAAEKLAWQGAYLTHYNRSQEERAGLEGGEFGEKAFQLLLNRMINYKAIPGFSNHSRGLAIDFMTDERGLGELGPYSSQKADWQNSWFWKWLGDNAATYHFSPLSTEEWHWDHS